MQNRSPKISQRELWLYQNPSALKQVQKGLQQSKEGKVRKLGTFARYVKEEI